MQYNIPEEQLNQARQPHELFLINLIFNHILMFITALGVVGSIPYFLPVIPLLSICILCYTLWRAKRSLTVDPWYVMCHWQICARRSKLFLLVVTALIIALTLGWVGYTYFAMEKVQTMALIGGLSILPTMVTVLVLIILESDALHQSRNGKLPAWIIEKFPNHEAQSNGT